MNPNLTRKGLDTGRNHLGRSGPSSFEIMECGFSQDWRPPIRESLTSGKKHLVRLDLLSPAARTRSFANDPDDVRWERDLGKQGTRTQGSPFYVRDARLCADGNLEHQESCTWVAIGCRVLGACYEIHFCKGTTMKTSVRSYRVPSGTIVDIHRRLRIEDRQKMVQYTENDTHFICAAIGGFPRGQEGHADLNFRGIDNFGGPPPGGKKNSKNSKWKQRL